MSSIPPEVAVALCAVIFTLIIACLCSKMGARAERFTSRAGRHPHASEMPRCHAGRLGGSRVSPHAPTQCRPVEPGSYGEAWGPRDCGDVEGVTRGPRTDEAILDLRSRADALIAAAGPVEARLDAMPFTGSAADADKTLLVRNAAQAARAVRTVAETLRARIGLAADLQVAVGIYEGLREDSGAVRRSVKALVAAARRLRSEPPDTPHYRAAAADLARFARAACDLTRAAHVLGAALGLE